ncbi:MAG: DUF4932 domain-containing protein [Sedimentisphaerales bacterium]|jgi:hypothetical protein
MRPFIWIVTVLVAIGLVTSSSTLAQTAPKKEPNEAVASAKNDAEAAHKVGQLPLRVVVDPRVELMSIIFRLAGNPEYCMGKVDSYTNDVEKHFGEFRTHPAVKLAQKMREEHGVSYDACMNMAVHLTDAEKCEEQVPFDPRPETLEGRWPVDGAREFLAATRQFVKDTNFNEFIAAHRSLYETTQSRMMNLLDKNAHVEWFDEYFGSRPEASFTVAVGLLNGPGNYGSRFRSADGKEELYCILGVWMSDDKGLPVFDPSVLETVIHEFSHSYVNPLTAKYKTEIDKYAKLYDPIADRMRSQAYPVWETCVNEHIIKALTTRYSYLKVSKEAGDNSLKYQKQGGFFYVPALCERLKYYENNRDKYKTFAEFYPELIRVFEDLSKQDLGKDFYFIPYEGTYEGTINAVGQDKNSVILILPTNEKDSEIQKNIHVFVRQYQQRFYPQEPIITDVEAIKRDLSKNSLILFGTMNGNLWLKENASKYPFKIEANQIVADKVYEGTDLRFISAWLNPQNPKRGILIYTAQQAKDIVKINSVFHGPTDFVIARGTEILKSANYNKKNKTWTLPK